MWPFFFALMGIWIAVFVAVFIFWLWMLIDLLQRKKMDDKLIWALILIFLNILGAILYYFLVKVKDKKKK
jgi:prolipoprotein diacylglyceryltransferase